jgi:hypothetical protein
MNASFATFGSNHLVGFDINPMKVMLVHSNEKELREILRQEPFNNQYCTTYPISEADRMANMFGMKAITLDELLKLEEV